MSKLWTVFGASGNQGGSVITAVLNDAHLSKEFHIRGISRSDSKPSIKKLAEKGVEIVVPSRVLPKAVTGSHTVFLMTNFWESMSAEIEIAQGKAMADACKAAGVEHVIFSTLLNTTELTKGRLSHISHFDGKAKIADYMRELGLPATFVLPGFFMSGFFDTIRKNEDGSYVLSMPVSEEKARIPLFNPAGDTGKFVNAALKAFPSSVGKQIYEATDYYDFGRMVSEFSEVIGKPAAYAQITPEVFKSYLPGPVAEELLENMLLLEDPGYYGGASLDESLRMLDQPPTTWKEFVQANKAKWL